MHDNWYKYLEKHFTNGDMDNVRKHLTVDMCPSKGEDIFKAFAADPDTIRVCILGLSPYPNQNDATGIAFGVQRGRNYHALPYSLKAIIDGITEEYNYIAYEPDTSLQHWVDQGVLLLNCALTCTQSNPTAHIELWKSFTKSVIEILDQKRIIFYLLGSEAKSYEQFINYSTVFKSIHPAASAYNSMKFDSKFKLVADTLYNINKTELKW